MKKLWCTNCKGVDLEFCGGNSYGCWYRCKKCSELMMMPTKLQLRANPERYKKMVCER